MFKFARKHSKSLWVKVMYSLIAFSFLIGFAVFIGSGITSYVRTGGLAPNIVAEVNGKQITLTEFERTLRNLKQEIDNPYIKELFLMQLVNRVILSDIAKSYGFSVSDSELAEYIAGLRYFSDSSGKFNEKIYYTVLKQNNITPSDFEQNMREELLLNNFKDFLQALINPTDEDLWWYFKKKNEKASFYVSKIEPEKFEEKIKPKESEIKDYYEAHKDEFKGNIRKTIEYILFPFAKYENNITISEDKIAAYYKENRKSFIVDSGSEKRLKSLSEVRGEIEKKLRSEKAEEVARTDAEKSRELLNSGETFEKIAEKFGVEKRTAGPVDEEEIKNIPDAGETLSTLFNSLDEGKISEVKNTGSAFLIARIVKTEQPAPLSLESARNQIIKKLKSVSAKELIKKEAEKIQKEIKTQNNPKKFLESLGYRVEETGDVTIGASFVKGIGFAPGFFTISGELGLTNRFPSKPYEFLGNYYVYWLKDKKHAERSVFESTKDSIKKEYIEEEVNKRLQDMVQNARKTAKIKINKEIFAEESKKGTSQTIPLNDLF
jgi:peptidyl-prolyl cis-trans isomerase D